MYCYGRIKRPFIYKKALSVDELYRLFRRDRTWWGRILYRLEYRYKRWKGIW